MRPLRSRRVWLVLVISTAAVGLLRGNPGKDPDAERIAGLVRQLGDKRYANREAAGKGLAAVGEKALPAVREAAASPDLEVSTRARQVTLAILRASAKSKSLGMEFAVIDARRFDMGSPPRERSRRPDETLHPVRITRPYLLGKYEVTQAEYERVMKVNPSHFAPAGPGKDKAGDDAGTLPVERVTWFDAVEFCNRLSELDGYEPFYKLEDVERDGNAITRATVTIAAGNGYRLPTEAEWEFACRAWSADRFHFGGENTGREANTQPGPATGYGGGPNWRGVGRTTKVGSYAANAFGLFEMHGNVGEWCHDWYDRNYYAASPFDDPKGPETGMHRAVRGGSWLVAEGSCRSASRLFHPPGERYYYLGFRVARSP
jgi:formylglycine-generating enzyme required for sulfatase activity